MLDERETSLKNIRKVSKLLTCNFKTFLDPSVFFVFIWPKSHVIKDEVFEDEDDEESI